MRYKPTAASIAFAFFGACLLSACRQPAAEADAIRPVKTVVLGKPGADTARVFPGTVRAAKRSLLSFRVSGPLVELPAHEGQKVRAGELLAKIDPRDYQSAVNNTAARLADLDAQYKAMKSARPEDIRRMEAMLAAAQSKLLEATASFRRYQRLYENNNISKAEYDQARAGRDVAESEVRSAEESLAIAKSGARPEDLEAMEARIRAMQVDLKKAQDQLSDTELRAPYEGIVAERLVDNFEYVTAFKDILSLQDIRLIEIVAQIPERVASTVRNLRTATCTARFPSAPGVSLPARPTEFAAEADPITRTYAVTFQATQPENFLVFAGMTAEIEVAGAASATQGFLVPVTAIFADDAGNNNVWLLEKGSDRVRKVKVGLGDPSDDGIWVVSGLQPGDQVITAGTHFLTANQQVRPVSDELRERR